MQQTVTPATVVGAITAPASKSYAQRAVAAAMFVHGTTTLRHMGLCNDTSAALGVARDLGATITAHGDEYTIQGGFLGNHPQSLNIGESGLSTRLFTPIAALSPRPITISGHGSILSRPMDAMEQPLRNMGATVTTTAGHLPLTVSGPIGGGEVCVDGSLSSQFITGLLMALPNSEIDTVLHVVDPRSLPYIDMTINVLQAFGVEIENRDYTYIKIPGRQTYHATTYNIEGDWSGASCMLVAGAIAGRIEVRNLNSASLQADRAIICALMRAGATVDEHLRTITVSRPPQGLCGFEFDATDCPDLFPALAALAAHCHGTSTIVGTNRLTHKESNRAVTIATEFAKLGVQIDITQPDTMIIHGRADGRTCVVDPAIDSHNDHRIAMATAVAALTASHEITISRSECVDKSYPNFWADLQLISKR